MILFNLILREVYCLTCHVLLKKKKKKKKAVIQRGKENRLL